MATRIFVRIPGSGRRKSFGIYFDGHPHKDPRLTAINESYKTKLVDFESARTEVAVIAQELRERSKADSHKYSDQNLDILQRAIQAYRQRTETQARSKRMAIASLRRCIDLLGQLSLLSSSIEDLQKLLKKQKPRSQPKVALFLNVLLQTAGRPDRLEIPTAPDPEVLYLTRKDFELMITKVDDKLARPIQVAFVSGARLGEVFALSRFGRKGSVWIGEQMYPEFNEELKSWYGPPKWDSKRWAVVMPWGHTLTREWIQTLADMNEASRQELRRQDWYEIVRTACMEAFPDKKKKWLTFRDVRHCYAIYWLDKGSTVRYVSQSMGNSETVVNKHYSGFIQTDEAEAAMLALDK